MSVKSNAYLMCPPQRSYGKLVAKRLLSDLVICLVGTLGVATYSDLSYLFVENKQMLHHSTTQTTTLPCELVQCFGFILFIWSNQGPRTCGHYSLKWFHWPSHVWWNDGLNAHTRHRTLCTHTLSVFYSCNLLPWVILFPDILWVYVYCMYI